MPRTRVNCPNCRQPVVAEIDQLFDMNVDPSAKQRLLSGSNNLIQCPNCGYQGNYASPIVYHDPAKELLLTFIPPEIGLPRNEQERLLGGYINQVVNKLPQEKRKAYLLRPQAALTMQGLVERILEADGITREIIQAQQQKVSLIQRLLTAREADREEIARQEDKNIDAEFFGLLRRVIEATMANGDQQGAQALAELQQTLLPLTTFGRELQAQAKDIEAAMADLKAAGRELTREKLLQLVIDAPTETRLEALVSLARPAMDYSFFQMLSDRVDQARGDGRNRLVELREKILSMTQEIDQQVETHRQETRKLLEAVLQAKDPAEAMMQVLPAVDEYFLQELNTLLEETRKSGDLDRLGKLQKVVGIIQAANTPPEAALVEELLDSPDEAARRKILEAHRQEITPEFLSTLTNIAAQVESSGNDPEIARQVKAIYRQALRFSMEQNL